MEQLAELRQRAEQAVRDHAVKLADLSHEEMQQLVHELRVHQIELEMQNEELHTMQAQLEASRWKLEASRRNYADLYDFAPVGYCTFDPEGFIRELNLTAATQLGVERGLLTDARLYPYIIEEDRDAFYLHLRQVFDTEAHQTCELRLRPLDGAPFPALLESIIAPAVAAHGRRCRTALTDITERKRAETALQEAKATAERANRIKDKFFAIIAHDLKNPFLAFLALIDLLEQYFRAGDAEAIENMFALARDAAENLFALLENLLTWARLQQGEVAYRPQQLELNLLVVPNIALLKPNAAQKQVTLENLLPADMLVVGDLNMLDAVVRNLLANAIKFTGGGGTVRVSGRETADAVEVSVSDTGVGMQPDVLANLFRLDARCKRLGTAGEKGTGLGLILCQEFVARHGGRLWAESEIGKGTTLTFTLPKAAPLIRKNQVGSG